MRWVTYASPEGDCVGVLSADRKIHALPPGVALVDLIGEGAAGLHGHGLRAATHPAEVVAVDQIRLRAPIPRPPAVRDCLCFLDHMRARLKVSPPAAELDDAWYRIPGLLFRESVECRWPA